jgi:hypothetical protein
MEMSLYALITVGGGTKTTWGWYQKILLIILAKVIQCLAQINLKRD